MEFKEITKEYRRLRSEYLTLSESERNGDEGKKHLQYLLKTYGEIKEVERNLGVWRGPFGNYNRAFR